jgi:hypothetical protein
LELRDGENVAKIRQKSGKILENPGKSWKNPGKSWKNPGKSSRFMDFSIFPDLSDFGMF